MKIISVWGYNTNPQYNPEKNFEGGGYLQPFGGAFVKLEDGREVVALLDDFSAGAFGDRYHLVLASCSGSTFFEMWNERDERSFADYCAVVGEDFAAFFSVLRDAVSWAALHTGYARGVWADPREPFEGL